eukprot:m.86467 g.86467  ORF g.86467 m.86467 type:complete len:705 (-) comp13553_c0_seq1:20-2134(-)
MKFGDYLATHAIPEWRSAYLDYEGIKEILEEIEEYFPEQQQQPNQPPLSEAMRVQRRSLRAYKIERTEQGRRVTELISTDIRRINDFFNQQLTTAKERLQQLQASLVELQNLQSGRANPTVTPAGARPGPLGLGRRVVRVLGNLSLFSERERKETAVRQAFLEYYRNLDLIRAYLQLNETGFRKILKKFKKVTGIDRSDLWQQVLNLSVEANQALLDLIGRTEHTFIQQLCNGDRRAAMRQLRVPENRFEEMDWRTLFAGASLGVFIVSILIISTAVGLSSITRNPNLFPMFRMMRGLLTPVLFSGLVGINMYIWSKYNINFPFIFELDLRSRFRPTDLFCISGFLGLVWCACTLMYIFQGILIIIPSPYPPLLFICTMFAVLFVPLNIFREGRIWLLRTIGRCLLAPFFRVTFSDFWFTDQLTSMSIFLLDFEYAICYLAIDQYRTVPQCYSVRTGIRPLISAWPFVIRILQCFRRYFKDSLHDTHAVRVSNLWNAGKYFTGIVVITFSSLSAGFKEVAATPYDTTNFFMIAFWALAAVINTSYSVWWDVVKDWGLFSATTSWPYLRPKLTYSPMVYYVCLVLNAILRLAWTISLSVGFFEIWFSDGLILILMVVELIRRCLWNFFRLEHQHLTNCENFLAVRNIPLPFEYLPSQEMEFGTFERQEALKEERELAEGTVRNTLSPAEEETDEIQGRTVPGTAV